MSDCPVRRQDRLVHPGRTPATRTATWPSRIAPLGPYRGADTTRPEPSVRWPRPIRHAPRPRSRRAAEVGRRTGQAERLHRLPRHRPEVVGPGFREVATKYMGDTGARQALLDKVRNGGAASGERSRCPPSRRWPRADLVGRSSTGCWRARNSELLRRIRSEEHQMHTRREIL